MANQKMKSESYQLLGGINSKWSPYALTPFEFLDLANFDFQTPNALTHRWGSTMYVGQTFPGQINSVFEFNKLDGSSQVIFSYSGGIFAGATTGNSQGLSFTLQGATQFLWYGVFENDISGNSPTIDAGGVVLEFGITGGNYIGSAGANLIGSTPLGQFYIDPSAQSDNTLDSVVFQNNLFAADGNKFFRYDGITTYPVGLPPVLFGSTGVIPGSSILAISGLSIPQGTIGFQYGVSLGIYYIFASYVNNRGFEGPAWPLGFFFAQAQRNASLVMNYNNIGPSGIMKIMMPVATPMQYGISSINLYSYYDASAAATITGLNTFGGYDKHAFFDSFWGHQGQAQLFQTVAASGSTLTTLQIGSSFFADISNLGASNLMIANIAGNLIPANTQAYLPLGLTNSFVRGNGVFETDIANFYPRFLELYQNRLFLAGFSAAPSTIWFSDIAEPEGYEPDFNFEVRTNDGDVITGLKAYESKMYIFKNKSFHVLLGDNPNNFAVQQISDQYGCINNRCSVVYDDLLIFLDRKGVVLWNGGNIQMLSEKVQPIFDSMGLTAATTQACAVHDKLRNQVLFAIPTNGATMNNVVMVYDYLIGAWTKYNSLSVSSLAAIQGRNNTKNAFYGSYSGTINWFGSSFLGDNGAGFTTYLKTRFFHDSDSTTKTFRRMYLNTDPPSSTLVFGVNFFQDFGSSVVKGTTMVLSQFQNRIDYGINAKAIAFELSNLQTSVPLRIYGFTIESRFQRAV